MKLLNTELWRGHAYDEQPATNVGNFEVIGSLETIGDSNNWGFSAATHFNHQTGELVISFGGTELPNVDPNDLFQDAVLALTNGTAQD